MSTIISGSVSDSDMNILKWKIKDENNKDNPMQRWVSDAISGKIHSTWVKFRNHWTPILLEDSSVANISGSREDFVQQVINREDYVDRWTADSGSGVL